MRGSRVRVSPSAPSSCFFCSRYAIRLLADGYPRSACVFASSLVEFTSVDSAYLICCKLAISFLLPALRASIRWLSWTAKNYGCANRSRLKFVLLGLLLTTHDLKGQIVGLLQTLPKAYPVLNTFGD